jgi:hypothetical protein
MRRFDPRTIRIHDLSAIVEAATAYGIKPDPKVAHGLTVHDVIHERTTTAPAVNILDLTEDQAVEHAIDLARTYALSIQGNGQSAAAFASMQLQDQITREVLDALAADAPRIIEGIRPTFDAAAAQLTAAIKAGITDRSTAQDVLNLEDAQAAIIWNDLPNQVRILEGIRSLRAKLSTTLGIAPQDPYSDDPFTDYTACFVHPDTGITSGPIAVYPNNAAGRREWNTPLAEWLTLAAWTKGNMQLN